MNNDRWPAELEEQLRRLPREENPPPELEGRIAAQLRRSRIESSPVTRTLLLAAVVAIAFFGLGFLAGREPARPATAVTTPQFALFLRESPGTLEGGLVEEYTQWARAEAQQGHIVGGAKLDDRGRILKPGVDSAVDFLRPGELGGYFLVTAPDLDSAARIAARCPHLKYGGTIELRPLAR
jgi:hypothetical protein